MTEYILVALGFVCFFEGLPYFAFPGKMKEWLYVATKLPENTLRIVGGLLMILGLMLVYLGRHNG